MEGILYRSREKKKIFFKIFYADTNNVRIITRQLKIKSSTGQRLENRQKIDKNDAEFASGLKKAGIKRILPKHKLSFRAKRLP
jgi:hypothetical protein